MKDDIIEELLDRVEENCKSIDTDELYDQMLDECYSFESVGEPFGHMMPSKVMKEFDEVGYRCGKNDWLDGEDITEVRRDGYYSTRDLEDVRDELLSELEDELSDVDDQMSDLDEDSEDYDYETEFGELVGQKDDLQAKIDKVRKYTF